jgi:hypothetical protein
MAAMTLVHLSEPALAIHLDIFREVSFLSIPVLDAATLMVEAEVRNDVRLLSKRAEVAATVIHRVLFGGTLNKEKYIEQVRDVLSDPADAAWLRDRVEGAIGAPIAAEVTDRRSLAGLRGDGERRNRAAVGSVFRRSFLRRPLDTSVRVVRHMLGQVASTLRPPGVVGCPGDPFPELPCYGLTLHLASAISIYGLYQPSVRSDAATLKTENEERYEEMLKRRWTRWAFLRWCLPSVFLWLQAKRAGIVLVDRLPLALRIARRLGIAPAWVARPASVSKGRP